MTHYAVYLELGPAGDCLAHVPSLPGCFVRAPTRDEALAALPDVIRAYHAWLRQHGEELSDPADPSTLDVAAISAGFGPFQHGDKAALFAPDRVPMHRAELEVYLRRAAYARADLLTLVRDLPGQVLDWQAGADSTSIRQILRHVGNVEQWYVSRLVDPATLPPEWEHDEDMPIFAFLEMERRTALERLRRLTDQELTAICYPTRWTGHPDEPWTARKALRRMLEHEREHTDHIREVLASWRSQLLARMAAERAGLLWPLVGLDEEALTRYPVFDAYTAKDLLAHVAGWDELFAERVELILAGRQQEIAGVELATRNAALHTERKDWPLEQVLDASMRARAAFLSVLSRVSDADLHRRRRLPVGRRPIRVWATWRYRHDAEHAADLAKWRKAAQFKHRAGPKSLLVAALHAGREELLATVELVPAADRATRPVCGEWTTKDLLGHIADWEWHAVRGLRMLAAGQTPTVDVDGTVDDWNREHAGARRGQPWDAVWVDLGAARLALLEALNRLSQEDLARPFASRWSAKDSAYEWVRVCAGHDREHAAGLRAQLGLRWPRRLLRAP